MKKRITIAAVVVGLIGLGTWQAIASTSAGPPPPPPGVQSDGSINISQVPDCVPVADSNGNVVGCVDKSQLYASPSAPFAQSPAMVVRGINGKSKGKVVGYFVPGKGFVAK